MSLKGVNFQLSATNAGQAAFNSFNRGLKGVQQNIVATKAVSRSWNAGLSENRRAVQQLGFQMTDFGVQIAGGQNAMLAFVQQGGQMLQVFGPIGAILATLLTIFGTLAIVLGKTGVGLEQVAGHFGVLEEEFMSISNGVKSLMDMFLAAGRVIVQNLDLIVIAATLAVSWMGAKWISALTASMVTTGAFSNALRALTVSYYANGAAATAAMVATNALAAAFRLLAPVAIIGGLALLIQWLMRTPGAANEAADGLANVSANAKKLEDATDALSQATSNYVASSAAAKLSLSELSERYGTLAFAARDALAAMASVDQAQAIKAMNDAIGASVDSLMVKIRGGGKGQGVLGVKLAGDLGLAADAAKRVEAAVIALDNAQGLKNQANAAADLVNELMRAYGSVSAMPAPMQEVVAKLASQVELAGQVQNAIEGATDQTRSFVSATGAGQSGLAGMVAQAWALVSAAGAAAGAIWGAVSAMSGLSSAVAGLRSKATSMLPSWDGIKKTAAGAWSSVKGMVAETRLQNSELATQYSLYGQGTEALREQVRLQDELYGTPKNFAADTGKGGGGGGGGGGSEAEKMNPVLERQKQLLESIIGPMEAYKIGSADLRVLLDQGAITMGQYTEKLRELRMAYLEAQNSVSAGLELGLARLTQQFSDATTIVANTVESMGQLLSSSLSEAFKTGEFDAKKFFSSLIGMIIDAITQLMIMKPLMEAITGGMGGGGGGGGLGGLLGKIFSFDGGGSTGSRPRTGGLDGKGGFMAMVHPDETIVDHTKGQSTGGQTVNVTMNITTRDVESFRASKGQLQAELARMVREGTRGN